MFTPVHVMRFYHKFVNKCTSAQPKSDVFITIKTKYKFINLYN